MILLAFPNNYIQKEYYDNPELIFFYNGDFLVYDVEKRQRIKIVAAIFSSYDNLKISTIRNMLNWWNPIWTRWVSKAYNYEHYRIENIILINKIINFLYLYKVEKIIFHTAIPHHIDSMSISIASEILNIKQIYLYSNVIDGRLLPIELKLENFNRKFIKYNLSNIKYENLLDEFVKNKLAGNLPKNNTKITDIKKSFFISVIKIVYTHIKIHLFFNKNNINFFKTHSTYDTLQILLQQKKYLQYYKKNKLSRIDTEKFLNSPEFKILIFAQYQPEATSFPEGFQYPSHLEIILKLQQLGYKGLIGYKEHPASWLYYDNVINETNVGIYRDKNYLKNIMNYKCYILDEKFSITPNQIYNYIPLTMTGTIAIERSLLGLQTIITGEPWFKGMPGTLHINELNMNSINNIKYESCYNIAIEAKSFITNILNNNAITNIFNIGSSLSSKNILSKKDLKIFFEEYKYPIN